jgi:hypothetical protein
MGRLAGFRDEARLGWQGPTSGRSGEWEEKVEANGGRHDRTSLFEHVLLVGFEDAAVGYSAVGNHLIGWLWNKV